MKKEHSKGIQLAENFVPIEGMRIGRIERINESGFVLVDFPGNGLGPLVARTTTSAKAETIRIGNPEGREVLLAFENMNPQRPIIIDIIYSLIEEVAAPAAVILEAEESQNVTIDGKRITFDAKEEIELKCGMASITLTSAGKIIIKGAYLLNQSSGANRIKGGSVQIN